MYNIIPYVPVTFLGYVNNTLPSVFKKLEIGSTWKEKVGNLTQALLKMPEAQVQTIHEFEDGLYYRTIIVPANTVLTGAEHKTPYRVIVKKGSISVNTEEGIKRITAPAEMDVAVGMERVGLTYLEEVIWTDVYVNEDNCKDLSVLEDRLYVIPECGLYDSRKRLEHKKVDLIQGEIKECQE